MSDQNANVDPETLSESSVAGSLVQQGLTIIRQENDSQVQVAVQRPRNEKQVWAGALNELILFPQFAKKAYYSIPYKESKDDADGKTVFVEGPSIKAAMALARRWGNCVNTARVVSETDDRFVVQGGFLDYETNFRTTNDLTVQKFFRTKRGEVIRLKVDRLNMAILAGMSKAKRNATNQGLPVWLVDGYFSEAKRVAALPPVTDKVKTPTERINDGINAIVGSFKIPLDAVRSYVSGLSLDSDEAILQHLIGLYNAFEDKEARPEDVFGLTPAPAAEKPRPAMPQEAKP